MKSNFLKKILETSQQWLKPFGLYKLPNGIGTLMPLDESYFFFFEDSGAELYSS